LELRAAHRCREPVEDSAISAVFGFDAQQIVMHVIRSNNDVVIVLALVGLQMSSSGNNASEITRRCSNMTAPLRGLQLDVHR
jgi:hypothetical protein